MSNATLFHEPDHLTVAQAALLLGRSRTWVHTALSSHELTTTDGRPCLTSNDRSPLRICPESVRNLQERQGRACRSRPRLAWVNPNL
ncbi:hypothetical protein J2Y55_001114 [Bosea sp. BE125]|nr:hypothetical protein [Bosea sp. BE125]